MIVLGLWVESPSIDQELNSLIPKPGTPTGDPNEAEGGGNSSLLFAHRDDSNLNNAKPKFASAGRMQFRGSRTTPIISSPINFDTEPIKTSHRIHHRESAGSRSPANIQMRRADTKCPPGSP